MITEQEIFKTLEKLEGWGWCFLDSVDTTLSTQVVQRVNGDDQDKILWFEFLAALKEVRTLIRTHKEECTKGIQHGTAKRT